jgi:hypothetical protein
MNKGVEAYTFLHPHRAVLSYAPERTTKGYSGSSLPPQTSTKVYVITRTWYKALMEAGGC